MTREEGGAQAAPFFWWATTRSMLRRCSESPNRSRTISTGSRELGTGRCSCCRCRSNVRLPKKLECAPSRHRRVRHVPHTQPWSATGPQPAHRGEHRPRGLERTGVQGRQRASRRGQPLARSASRHFSAPVPATPLRRICTHVHRISSPIDAVRLLVPGTQLRPRPTQRKPRGPGCTPFRITRSRRIRPCFRA